MKTYILPIIINVITIILTSYITHLLSISKFKHSYISSILTSSYEYNFFAIFDASKRIFLKSVIVSFVNLL